MLESTLARSDAMKVDLEEKFERIQTSLGTISMLGGFALGIELAILADLMRK
jgi:hypothetical protein